MKSIRRRLGVWLAGGFALLWIGAGAGIYAAVRSGLLKAVDAELAVDAQVLRFVVRGEGAGESPAPFPRHGGARRLQARIPDYDEPGSGAYYQAWKGDGTSVERSASLGEANLPFPGGAAPEPLFATVRLADGGAARLMSFRLSPGGKGRPKGERSRADGASVIAVAMRFDGVEQTLSILVGGLVVVGLLGAAGAVLLVGAALNQGLKPLRDLGGQMEGIDANLLDACFDSSRAPLELHPIYDRLNDLMARIQKSFERERRFSSDLAHEMRTPVAELKMLSEVALKWPDQAGEKTHREGLEIACQLESMIESLLALARLESGEASPKRDAVPLEEAFRKCWERYSGIAREKDLRVRLDFDEDAAFETDPSLLEHILNNLLGNAVEYTDKGGEILVTGRPARIEVANSAPALKEEEVAHFFERYWRRDPARGDRKHAGLGLALAKACAEALGLRLSAKLEGTVVRFLLEDPQKLPAA